MEIQGLEVVNGWIIFILTVRLGHDTESLGLCRANILELQSCFQQLFKLITEKPHRRVGEELDFIYKIQELLLLFQKNNAGLFIKNKKTELLVQESLSCIHKYDYVDEKTRIGSSCLASQLLSLWVVEVSNIYNDTKWIEINNFFNAGYCKRLMIRIKELSYRMRFLYIILLVLITPLFSHILCDYGVLFKKFYFCLFYSI